MNDIISVIIPVYNVEKYLSECIDSVINQTYTNLEIILIDDGSPDGSGKICDEYAVQDKRIKVIHKENEGVSSARNLGLDIAKGDYVTFIDADDFVDIHYAEYLYENMRNKKSDLVFCGYGNYTDNSFEEMHENFPDFVDIDFQSKTFLSFFYRFISLNNYIFLSSWRVLYKKELLANIRFNSNIKVGEDSIFLLNVILKAKNISYVNSFLYFYRRHNQSVMFLYKKNYLKNQLELVSELEKIKFIINNKALSKKFDVYYALLGYWCLSNEIKNRANINKRSTINKIRKSTLCKYFNLKNGLKIYGLKMKIKFVTIWVLFKFRLV